VQFEQMHQPIGRLRLGKNGESTGEIYNGQEWIKDQPAAAKGPHTSVKTYGDLWGIGNYAMARLLTPAEVKFYPDLDTKGMEEGVLYLELIHHPNLTYPKPLQPRGSSMVHTLLNPMRTLIPVQEKHLKALMDNMYTARFEVKDGIARRYSVGESPVNYTNPLFTGVPDGTYEFYYGKADRVGFMGWTTALPKDHPLYRNDSAHVQLLYNLGIDLNTFYQPSEHNNLLFPHRYAYFRDGDLYLLGAPIYKKDDPVLQAFVAREEQKEKQSSENRPYLAFKDRGPPLKEGKIDADFIRSFGLPLSVKQYLVLGDNHAMSADSRIFGFLPEENLQGVPSLILWPPGERWGIPNEPPYPLFTRPRLIVWSLAALTGLGWYLWHRRRMRQSVFRKM
jgi:signal peptidase I